LQLSPRLTGVEDRQGLAIISQPAQDTGAFSLYREECESASCISRTLLGFDFLPCDQMPSVPSRVVAFATFLLPVVFSSAGCPSCLCLRGVLVEGTAPGAFTRRPSVFYSSHLMVTPPPQSFPGAAVQFCPWKPEQPGEPVGLSLCRCS
jgi:hypothetical protein